MKTLRCFLRICVLVLLVSGQLDAMKRQRDIERIELRCHDSEESISVPAHIIQHSSTLNTHLKNYPLASFYPIPVKVADQETLCSIIDCLYIIDSGEKAQNRLCEYLHNFLIKHTPQRRIDLVAAATNLNIGQLLDGLQMYPVYAQAKLSDILDRELDGVIQQATAVFEKIEGKQHSAIIIDIDDTALSRAQSFGMIRVNDTETCFPYYKVLDKVFIFYEKIVAMGFKIFFLTARVEKTSPDQTLLDGYEATVQNLKGEGYNVFEKVICVPYEARMRMQKEANGDDDLFVDLHAQWKESERNKIAANFTIAGTLDDTEENLIGKNVGHAVLIPRFF